MKKILLLLFFIALIPVAFSITYPVKELGNCASQSDCEKYCNVQENMESCIAVAEAQGLITKEELNTAVKMLVFIKNGETPGKCSTEQECNNYCDKEENLNECVDFALKIGEISKEEAQMAKKSKGKGPGGCKREECRTYCNDESHLNECIDFAVANGIIDAKEAEMVKKTGGKGPGNCKGKYECDSYCQNPAHSEECFDFSVQYGLIDAKDVEMTKACMKGPESCNSYCYSSDERFKQCIVMWEDNSNDKRPSKEDLARMKVQYYDSPGNCKLNQECMQKYCSQDSEAILFECQRFNVKLGQRTEAEFEKWKQEYEQRKQESESQDKGMTPKKGMEGCPDISQASDGCYNSGGEPSFGTDPVSGCLKVEQCNPRTNQGMQCGPGWHAENDNCVQDSGSQTPAQPQDSGNYQVPPSGEQQSDDSNPTPENPPAVQEPQAPQEPSPEPAPAPVPEPTPETPPTGQVTLGNLLDIIIKWLTGKA